MSDVQPNEGLQETSTATQATPDAAPAPGTSTDVAPTETRPSGPAYVDDSAGAKTNATPFWKPELQFCPRCNFGLLYPIWWDDEATHETMQPIYAPAQLSGGSVRVSCFNCGHGESFPLNPREAPVNPNPGA